MSLWRANFKPMLLKEIDKPFNSKDYLYEIKYDGIRVLIYVSPKTIKIISRNLNDITYLFPELNILKDKVTKKVALCKTVLSTKFYYAILSFKNNGIIMNTLYFNEEVNIPNIDNKKDIKPKELEMAVKLIESLSGKFEPEKYKDEYQEKISHAIKDKMNGKQIKGVKKQSKKQINDLMKALEESLKSTK